ncbi:MAG: murein L,D-transpeptidase catalytic domain family protein [Bdellovibrionaceae bacterium]|nr:murein L,D-transpeptidase catalytic domain family protein [Pseudobdellovibrionaceae bacterium]
MRNQSWALFFLMIFTLGLGHLPADAEAARNRRQTRIKKIPVPTPRPTRYAQLPRRVPVPEARPRVDEGGTVEVRAGDTTGACGTPLTRTGGTTTGERVFRPVPAYVPPTEERDDRANAEATPGADLPPVSADLDAVNPNTIAPGIKVPSLSAAFARALKRDPKRCTEDLRRLSHRTTASQRSEKFNMEDYIRAGVRAGASESQMRQTLAAFAANKASLKNQKHLAIIDYSDRSTAKRLFILDLETNKVKSYHVAHGKGSDPNGRGRATKFGNVHESKRTSLGCYVAGGTYDGTNGRSLILHGLEQGVNDNACARSIVMHGADYVGGSPGRSYGCPAVKHKDRKEVFNKLGNGGLICSFNGDDRS